jgi:hypothetical protein
MIFFMTVDESDFQTQMQMVRENALNFYIDWVDKKLIIINLPIYSHTYVMTFMKCTMNVSTSANCIRILT